MKRSYLREALLCRVAVLCREVAVLSLYLLADLDLSVGLWLLQSVKHRSESISSVGAHECKCNALIALQGCALSLPFLVPRAFVLPTNVKTELVYYFYFSVRYNVHETAKTELLTLALVSGAIC